MGLELSLSDSSDSSTPVADLIITINADCDTPFEGTGVGVSEVEVGVTLTRCRIVRKVAGAPARPAAIREGIELDAGASLFAKGDISEPLWIFKATGIRKALDGIYSTIAPPACSILLENEEWCIVAEASIYVRNLVFADEAVDPNKAKIEDRLRALLLFGDQDCIVIKSACIKGHGGSARW